MIYTGPRNSRSKTTAHIAILTGATNVLSLFLQTIFGNGGAIDQEYCIGPTNEEAQMATVTYYVALAFTRSEDGDIVACEPKEAQSSHQAARMANALASMQNHCGAIAFSRTGDPAVGEFDDAVVLKTFGDVDGGLIIR